VGTEVVQRPREALRDAFCHNTEPARGAPMSIDKEAPKAPPAAASPEREDLLEAIERLQRGRALQHEVRVRLRVAGGGPDARYELELLARSDGLLRYQLADRRRDREAADRLLISPPDFASLLVAMDAAELVTLPALRPPIPPDGLVAQLRIELGGEVAFEATFPADLEQARAAAATPPEPLTRAMAAFLDFAEQRSHVTLRR
jgi:hypothetical protein